MDIKERNLRIRQEKAFADKAKQAATDIIPEGSGLKEINKVKGTTDIINKLGDVQPVTKIDDFISKIATKRAAMQAAKSGGIKALGLLAGPVGVALNAADAMAGSESAGEGSDMPEGMTEENKAYEKGTPEEQVRRYNKIKSMLE